MTIGEVARRRQRPGSGEEKLDVILHRRGLGKQPQRRTEPMRSPPGRKPRRSFACLPQDVDGGEVALSRRPLDVVGPPRGCKSRAASISAHRSWAPSRQPPAVASYTARRTAGVGNESGAACRWRG